jgi:hypothetical protein
VAAKKFLRNVSGVLTEILGVQTSAGAGNAGDIPALNDSGVFDTSLMPPGIGADTSTVQASEALSAGDFVNIYDGGSGVFRTRKADADGGNGKKAHGFVLAAVSNGANATIYHEGTNNQVSSMTPGDVYLSETAGAATATPPTASGSIVQRLGVAVSATAINVEFNPPIVLA